MLVVKLLSLICISKIELDVRVEDVVAERGFTAFESSVGVLGLHNARVALVSQL